MSDILYQVTTIGNGFNGPGQAWEGNALDKLRLKLKDMEGPFHYRGHPKVTRKRDEMLDDVKGKWHDLPVGHDPIRILGAAYDQPGVALRTLKALPELSPFALGAQKYERQPYAWAEIFPPRGDCSGLLVATWEDVLGVTLGHQSNQIWHDTRFHNVDREDLRSGDVIVKSFHSGPYTADDVTICYDENRSLQIGARPSVKPGYSHDGVQIFTYPNEFGWDIAYRRWNG